MKEGDIVVIDTAPDVSIHAKLNRPLVSGWVVELVCENGVQCMRATGHPAFHGYLFWTNTNKISYEHGSQNKGLLSCSELCALLRKSQNYIKHTVETRVNRKLKKVFIWRILSFSVASVISYLYLGEFKRSLELTVILTVVLTAIQYYYESFWEKDTI